MILKIYYGMSQNPDTKDYIIVLQGGVCRRCNKEYADANYNWCRTCQKNDLKDFTNRTSGNKKIDDFIQEMQLKVNTYRDIVFEWIPYDQFDDIEEIGQGGFATIYSATWDGPLKYNTDTLKYKRCPEKIALKCLLDAQDITDKFLNEI